MGVAPAIGGFQRECCRINAFACENSKRTPARFNRF
jgi:hypothetical protein